MSPRVSILLPVHEGSYLREAMDTLLQQTERNFELLVLDDASDAATKEMITDYAQGDRRIRVLRNETNLGLPATLNRGLAEAKADLVARADADDIYHAERLSKQLDTLDSRTELLALSCGHRRIDATGDVLYIRTPLTGSGPVGFRLLFNNTILHPGVVFRKEPVMRLGGYDEDLWTAQDTDLWGRLSALGPLDNLPEPLVDWRVHDKTVSKTRGDKGYALSMEVLRRNQERYLGEPVDKAFAEDAVETWRGNETLSADRLRRGVAQLDRIWTLAREREDRETLYDFKTSTSFALRQHARRAGLGAPGLLARAAEWRLRDCAVRGEKRSA